jgi:hypothetical protein
MVSVERAAALRNNCLNLTENLSIGFRFGEGTDVAVATVDVTCWHKADAAEMLRDVRFRWKIGH